MKSKSQIIIIGIILIAGLTGCPYESPVSLGDSCNSTIDPTLAGTWVYRSGKNPKDTIVFLKFNDHEYYIEFHGEGKSAINIASRGRGFITKIRKQPIINFCEIDHPEKVYFSRYEMHENMMILHTASDNFIKQTIGSSGELLDFYSQNMEKDGFYEEADTMIRVK